jgi:hypothetical protein
MAVNFSVKDFSKENSGDNWIKYTLKEKCIIFGKSFEKEPLEISVHEKQSFENLILKINEYLNWLGGECQDELIKYYNENMDTEEEANDEWYNKLEIYRILLTITETGKLFAEISCGDNYWEDHILDIEMEYKKVTSMNYDG